MKYLLIFCLLLLTARPAFAQENGSEPDTILMLRLAEAEVTSTRLWANDTVQYRYNQMKYYVKTILPYLNAATKTFAEIDAKLNEPGLSKKDRKRFIAAKDKELRSQFEDKVKKLNTTQGVLLIKLIGRQTGVNIYSILKEFKNPLTAMKWQAWAKFNGHNLNRKYHPEEEPNLEHIMNSLGYPLPPFYAKAGAEQY